VKRLLARILPCRPRLAWGAAAVLALLLAGTWALRAWRTAAVKKQASQRQKALAREALSHASEQFAGLRKELLQRAAGVAQAQPVRQTLRQRRADAGASVAPLVRYTDALDWPARYAVEIYDPLPRVLAWRGSSVPLGDAPDALRFLERPQTAIAGQGGTRQALVAWQPVRTESGRAVGGVRVSQEVRFRPPVQNDYLQRHSLAQQWTQATGVPMTVRYGTARPDSGYVRPLEGVSGEALGYAVARPPPPGQLVSAIRARYGDWMALWATLLLAGAVAGLWKWFAAALPQEEAPAPRRLRQVTGRLAGAAAGWVAVRYALLALDVPARWLSESAVGALFDPTQFASAVGAGVLRSTGDLLLSGLFVFGLGVALFRWGGCFWSRCRTLGALRKALRARSLTRVSPARALGVIAVASAGAVAGMVALAGLARRVVLDSTFDFFARTGLLPRPLVLVVFCALLLGAGALVLATAGLAAAGRWGAMRYAPRRWRRPRWGAAGLAAGALPLAGGYWVWDPLGTFVAGLLPLLAGGTGLLAVRLGLLRRTARLELLTLRRLLPAALFLAVLLYPLLYGGMHTRRQMRLHGAVADFAEGGDPRVSYALRRVLRNARDQPALRRLLSTDSTASRAQTVDSLGSSLLHGSLLSSLSPYDVSLALLGDDGTPVGRYASGPAPPRPASQSGQFNLLRSMYRSQGGSGVYVEQMTGWPTPERFQYVGLAPVAASPSPADTTERLGWLVLRAVPQAPRANASTPFPRALLPNAYAADLYSEMALAEFQDGQLMRSRGRDFGRARLPSGVRQALRADSTLWRTEESEGQTYLTLYHLPPAEGAEPGPLGRRGEAVVAARVAAVTTFDHLYYALRLVVAGFLAAGPLWGAGLALRWRAGLLPAPRVRFRDKVLGALLGVGAVAVVVMGVVGLRVLTAENERATQQWLRQRLEQVEQTLALEARAGEPLYQTAQRVGIGSLAARLGLDLNLYRGARLVSSSRPRLAREGLIDERLPVGVYRSLYLQGERFAATPEKIGSFPYTAGFRTLTDAQGRPRYVLSAPTLPEQERIAEEQSRTVAYLFGSLLVLILLVTVTALVLASALTRPLRRLRKGLEAVGKGEFARRLPTDTRDEIGELAETFNEMRDQLAESRRKLAQQEREGAWREMARQVAHEIKNPLTPMKLSVQHLRRAFEQADVQRRPPAEQRGDGAPPEEKEEEGEKPADEDGRFPALFERITSTLIDQIDGLSRIAGDFSDFARLPTRIPEPLDLSEVVEGAVALMQEEEPEADIRLEAFPEPLVVEADPEELRRLYVNLIKNALQALPESGEAGRRQGHVEVETTRVAATGREGHSRQAPSARTTVTDNGRGIPEDLREKIFQPNFSTKTSGTGLGLAIAQKSIEEMGGAIGFETEEGVGTTFWVELPLEEREEGAEAREQEGKRAAVQEEEA
jgi:signal transduction histidine kinase